MLAMANIRSDIGSKKCKLRSVPQFYLWWLIMIQNLVGFPCVFAMCQGVSNITVAVYPEGTLTVLYGKPLELFCVAEKFTSNDLEFYLGGSLLESEIVNSTTKRLYIENPPKQVNTYYCLNKITNRKCISRVLIDSPPTDVSNFSCVSKNLESLNCTWMSTSGLSLTNHTLQFIADGSPVTACNATRVGNMSYCSWSISSSPRYRQMDKFYLFYLRSCNVFGCNDENFTIDHFAIVKPEPPSDLEVLRNNSHSVLLQWTIPQNMFNFLSCGLEHRIEYQIAKIDNTSYFRSVDTSSLPLKNKTYKFLLNNLPYAHMQYEVRIYIRPKAAVKEEFWSDFTYYVFYTAGERPHRPPDTIIGAFDQAPYKTKRRINVYWKQLEEYEEAGTNFTYKVIASQHNRKYKTLLADKNKSLSYVVLENASVDAINVSFWSMNDNGSSLNSSHLYIPPYKDTEPLRVTSFTKLAYENGTYKLSWVGIKHVDSYTLFWCPHNSTQICAGRMNFITLTSDSTEHVIDLPRENRYQFAISANNGTKTSGMVWAICDISKDGIPMYGYPVKMNHDAPGKSFVKITWRMDCTLQEGIITGYIMSYCPVLDTSNVCATKDKTVLNITNPKQMEINITNLEPYTTYLFTLALNTTYGEKSIDNASTGVTTIEDTPTKPVNVQIANITHDSLVISWDPPLHKNGIIGKYVINNDGKELKAVKVHDDKHIIRRNLTLNDLKGFTNYSLSVQACNNAISSCSKVDPGDTYFVRTRIGPPGILKAPTVKSNPDILMWDPPDIPGGTVDRYQIKIVKGENMVPEIINTTNTNFSTIHCEGGVTTVMYRVRAINFDDHGSHGADSDRTEVHLPVNEFEGHLEYPGEWSPPSPMACGTRDGLAMTFILMTVFGLIGLVYCGIKCYKKYRKMEDIKPVLPNGLGVPEKDISKYTFAGWNPSTKDEKPSSDEMLLLPNSRATVPPAEVKEKDNDICATSDHTDSTALSDNSQGPVDRQVSVTSDDGSNSSLHLEVESSRVDDSNENQQEKDLSNSETDSSQESSPYLNDAAFKKYPTSGYVQQPTMNNATGYVQSVPAPVVNSPTKAPVLNASSSYVMAALSPPIFTTGVTPMSVVSHPQSTSGYIRPEEAQTRSPMNFPKLGPSPTKLFGPENLPSMPTLPMPAKHGVDNSYIQLQSLDSLPSHKQTTRNIVPLKPPTSSGYVSPGDAVINKHLNNILSGGQLAEESAILDPKMSPDAYCRFSWSTDPANDNLHSLLADPSRLNSSKN